MSKERIDSDVEKLKAARFAAYFLRLRINELSKGQKYRVMEARRNLRRELDKLENFL